MPANNKLVTVDDLSSVASSIATKADNRFPTDAFKYVAVGGVTMAASTKADTMNLVAGNNVTITPNASTKTITVAATGGGGGGDLGLSIVNGKLCVTYETT